MCIWHAHTNLLDLCDLWYMHDFLLSFYLLPVSSRSNTCDDWRAITSTHFLTYILLVVTSIGWYLLQPFHASLCLSWYVAFLIMQYSAIYLNAHLSLVELSEFHYHCSMRETQSFGIISTRQLMILSQAYK